LEFQHLCPDEAACTRHPEHIRWSEGFDSVLKIAARVESLTYRNFYESAQTHTIPVEPDEPEQVSTTHRKQLNWLLAGLDFSSAHQRLYYQVLTLIARKRQA
jgi:hypothetical protein